MDNGCGWVMDSGVVIVVFTLASVGSFYNGHFKGASPVPVDDQNSKNRLEKWLGS